MLPYFDHRDHVHYKTLMKCTFHYFVRVLADQPKGLFPRTEETVVGTCSIARWQSYVWAQEKAMLINR